ncbi:potassium channel, subfamily K, member 16-like [Glandiceps talaboti]
MHWLSTLILSFCFLIYLFIGAAIFSYLESSNEDDVRVNVRQYKDIWLGNHTCVSNSDLEQLITAVITAYSNGVSPNNNATSPSNWDFSSSFFFSGTVVTTIGYGHISPTTSSGQIFCIFFAFIGIPLCGVLLSDFGSRMGKQARRLEERIGRWRHAAKYPRVTRLFYLFVLVGIGTVFLITFPSLIFMAVEGWAFRESWYYCFVTLLTVGFGDFVMGVNEDKDYPTVYKWCGYAWIFIGLAYVALIINMVSDVLTKWGMKIEKKTAKKNQEADENGKVGENEEKVKDDAEVELTNVDELADNGTNGTDM